ncbi:hypothetical protein K435DRAFT_960414 [Dendrothele bispora CBS 962.96]|uniref:Tc1-like transposase DDE domain-containing protein n=2 Tax=Dendrothele bispora (strain CBS 962.96) TaxID=1314807 RepID=A0A4S8MUQ8_DENBC|nr:hypothetical protein K435DRAFT_960414 [Dendrothele bispora CBS 962.96]
MVNRRISSDLKEAAIRMWEHGWELSDICAALIVSPRSMYRWRALFDELGRVTKPPSVLRGRPRIIGSLAIQACRDVYSRNPDTYLKELQWYLAIHHDLAISIPALHSNLEKAGLTRKVLQKIAEERDEQLRTDFKNCIQNPQFFSGTGREFVTVDESSKNDHTTARRYGRAPIGLPAQITDVFIRGTRYSLVAALSTNGYIAAKAIEGSYDAAEFFSFILDDVVPQMNAYPGDQSVLIMDNARIHHNEALKEALNSQGIMLIYLPPYSPDLNPIEESFSTWKAYLQANGVLIRTHDDPILALLDSCGCITAEMAVGWFRHAGYIIEHVT